jgi:hypothetical protein
MSNCEQSKCAFQPTITSSGGVCSILGLFCTLQKELRQKPVSCSQADKEHP